VDAVVTAVGVVGQTGELSPLYDVPAPVRAAISFVLVLAVGAGLLCFRERAVHRAVDLTIKGTPLAVVYGGIAFGLLAFVGGYAIAQMGRVTTDLVFLRASLVALGLAGVALGGFGYLVGGIWVTEVEGDRRPWVGAAVGAGISAVPFMVPTLFVAVLGWLLLAAFGLGNVTREWIHGDRTVEAEGGG
jgi:hypothetical protein